MRTFKNPHLGFKIYKIKILQFAKIENVMQSHSYTSE